MRALASLFVLFLSLSAGVALAAEDVDPHLNSNPMSQLFTHSVLAHGFIHGYEEGFHIGDLDLQMGRGARPLNLIPEAKNTEYRKEYGSHRDFAAGYARGFAAGYLDAIAGREFQADRVLSAVAAGLPELQPAGSSSTEGFASGAFAGFAGSGNPSADNLVSQCRRSDEGHRDDGENYCAAFARGFGFARSQTATELARRGW